MKKTPITTLCYPLFALLAAPFLMQCTAPAADKAEQPEAEQTTVEVKTMTAESKTFVYEAETEWQPAGENVVRQILGYNNDIMTVKVKFLVTGAEGTPHTHPHTQTTYVASGKFRFTIDGETMDVSAGDGLYMKPNVLHGCVCLEPGILIDSFSPMREDFLK